MHFAKKIAIWGAIIFVFYFILSHHFIIIDNSIKLLKKSTLSLNYTIFSTKAKIAENILEIDVLRRDGIGDLLVKNGKLGRKKLKKILESYDEYDDEEEY